MRFTTVLFVILLVAGSFLLAFQPSHAQGLEEPDVQKMDEPLSPLDFDIRRGLGFRIEVNNFGFGAGGEYRRVVSRNTKAVLEFQITNIKDEKEQSFQSRWGGSTISNKYNRVLAFPLTFGIQRRLFASSLSDNFRLFAQASAGPAPAFVYPYYNHTRFGYDYGFRITSGMAGAEIDPHYDPFEGWSEGSFIWGGAGLLSIGANLGGDFGNLQTVRIGYFFYYYPDGIQIMEPDRLGPGGFQLGVSPENLPSDAILPANDKQSFFGTPYISLVFGTMW